jgi:hypothetical protein
MKNQKVHITADSVALAKKKAKDITPSSLSIRKVKIMSKGKVFWGLWKSGKKAKIEVVFGGNKCAKCGRTWDGLERHFAEAEARGTFVYGSDVPVLLYCEKCGKSFCGSCQADLGMDSGCPDCKNPLYGWETSHIDL